MLRTEQAQAGLYVKGPVHERIFVDREERVRSLQIFAFVFILTACLQQVQASWLSGGHCGATTLRLRCTAHTCVLLHLSE